MFLIYLVNSRVQRAVWLNGLKFLTACHHFAKFSSYRPCDSSYTAAKTFYVTLQHHMIKVSDDFLYIPILPKLIAIDIVLMDI